MKIKKLLSVVCVKKYLLLKLARRHNMNRYCNMQVFLCPSCNNIHGGVITGGYIKQCNSCSFKYICSVRDRLDKLSIKKELCSDCLIYHVKKITGEDI